MAFEKRFKEAHFMAVGPIYGTRFVQPSFTDSFEEEK